MLGMLFILTYGSNSKVKVIDQLGLGLGLGLGCMIRDVDFFAQKWSVRPRVRAFLISS